MAIADMNNDASNNIPDDFEFDHADDSNGTWRYLFLGHRTSLHSCKSKQALTVLIDYTQWHCHHLNAAICWPMINS